MTLSNSDFETVAGVVRKESAIVLEAGKEYLVETRLAPLVRTLGLVDIEDLVARLRLGNTQVRDAVVEALTTNETSFFRDAHPFELLRTQILPELIERRSAIRTLNIWFLASSSGQEPYSVAMLLRDHFPQILGWRLNLLGGDLSDEMNTYARKGEYSQLEVNRGLPATMLVKHFTRSGARWQIKPELASMVSFQKLNLIGKWPVVPSMDIVFCRNVLIYFDPDVKRQILEQIHTVLAPDGAMLLGGAETTINITNKFERVSSDRTSYYRKAALVGAAVKG